MKVPPTVYIGWDPREAGAFAVARHSMRRHLSAPVEIRGLVLDDLILAGLYKRPLRRDGAGRLHDLLSVRDDYDGAMSTEHACARFLVPFLGAGVVGGGDWVGFVDGDILVRDDIASLIAGLDPQYAVYCVKHDYQPAQAVKMDGQVQTRYARKNWSSVCFWNLRHPANLEFTSDLDMANSLPGRDLHAFMWLEDRQIGALDPRWNWLVGHSDPAIDPALVHFTSGTPEMDGYRNVDFADEWRTELAMWASADR